MLDDISILLFVSNFLYSKCIKKPITSTYYNLRDLDFLLVGTLHEHFV